MCWKIVCGDAGCSDVCWVIRGVSGVLVVKVITGLYVVMCVGGL